MKKLLIVVSVFLWLISSKVVLAESSNIYTAGTAYWKYYGKVASEIIKTQDGQYVFCVDPGKIAPNNIVVESEVVNDDAIVNILHYAEVNKAKWNYSEDQYYISVWIALNSHLGNFDIIDIRTYNDVMINELLDHRYDLNKVEVANEYELVYNTTSKKYEASVDLHTSRFSIAEHNINSNITGTVLNVSTTQYQKEEFQVDVVATYNVKSALIFKTPSHLQDVVKVAHVDETVNKTLTFKNNDNAIVVEKLSRNKQPLVGVEFNLLDSNKSLITSASTQENGMLVFSQLALGDYFIQETKTLNNYLLDDTLYPVSISENNNQVVQTIYNDLLSLEIVKVNQFDEILTGVKFTVYKLVGEEKLELGSYITDEFGVVLIEGVSVGETYIICETETLYGYKLLEEEVVVLIENNQADKQVVIVNQSTLPQTGQASLFWLLILVLSGIIIGKKVLFKR